MCLSRPFFLFFQVLAIECNTPFPFQQEHNYVVNLCFGANVGSSLSCGGLASILHPQAKAAGSHGRRRTRKRVTIVTRFVSIYKQPEGPDGVITVVCGASSLQHRRVRDRAPGSAQIRSVQPSNPCSRQSLGSASIRDREQRHAARELLCSPNRVHAVCLGYWFATN